MGLVIIGFVIITLRPRRMWAFRLLVQHADQLFLRMDTGQTHEDLAFDSFTSIDNGNPPIAR